MGLSHSRKDSIRAPPNTLCRAAVCATLGIPVTKLLTSAIALLALVLPATAGASLATVTSRDVPLDGGRVPASAMPRFDLVGVHSRGSGSVQFRTRSTSGRWGPWQAAAPEAEDLPDRGSAESGSTRAWRVGNPIWVGPSNAIRYRTAGEVTALRAFFVRSPEVRVPLRALTAAAAPAVVTRSAWGADESIRRNAAQFASDVRYSIVHHTAGTNSYSRSEAPAIMRGIQLYHVKSNGWNDIGYNFLVDRFGTIYEGRYGGIDRNVVGAHAKGFNTGSVGVAVIGSFESEEIPAAAEASLASLLAWRLDLAHVDPLTTLTVISSGSDRFPSGIPTFLRVVSGHRDTGLTACPGDALYARLATIAGATEAIGLPKLYEPRVSGALGGLVRFRARLSEPLPWRVAIADAAGAELAAGDGFGEELDWIWDSTGTTAGVQWRLTAGATVAVTSASGSLGSLVTGPSPAPTPGPVVGVLAITGAAADPETISPNGDGEGDLTTVTYTTTAPATVDVTLLDAAGATVTQLLEPTRQVAGEHALSFDGLGLPDATYTLVVTAIAAGGARVSSPVAVRITRTLGRAAVAPALFSPNADGRGDRLAVTFELGAAATVRVRVLRDGRWVATPFSGVLQSGPRVVAWDGAKRVGRALDGAYTAIVEATDTLGTSSVSLPFVTDALPPRLRVLAGRRPRIWVSEPAALTVRVNGSVRRLDAAGPGPIPLTGIRTIRTLAVVAVDAAGNRGVLRRS